MATLEKYEVYRVVVVTTMVFSDVFASGQCNMTETGMLSVLVVLGSIVAWMMIAVRSSETHRAQLDLERQRHRARVMHGADRAVGAAASGRARIR